jgi:hypothetical protein
MGDCLVLYVTVDPGGYFCTHLPVPNFSQAVLGVIGTELFFASEYGA